MIRLQTPLPERYTVASPDALAALIGEAKATLADRLMILGHHYQREDVMRWADCRGDSFGLSRQAADNATAEFIVFCGVHFMAESADILTGPDQKVILPDLNAGCSMADMADVDTVEEAWEVIASVSDIERVVPITYMNSSAALKAFVGEHGGAVCTSSNARTVLEWALGRGDKVLFFPDQHLGRNTAFDLGYDAPHMRVWDPREDLGGLTEPDVKEATFLLWKGHCTVHQRFRPEHVAAFRAEHPDGEVLVHPECSAWPSSTPTRRSCRSTRWCAPARRCRVSIPSTWPGCSRVLSRARCATGSRSTTPRPSGRGSRWSGCWPSPERIVGAAP